MTATPAQPHLAALLRDLEVVRAATERLAALSDTQLTWRPEPGVWSIAECFGHLRIVDEGYSGAIREALDHAEPGTAPFTPTWYAKLYIHFVSPASTRRLPTLSVMVPTEAGGSASALPRFLAQQAELEALIRDADTKDINTGRFSSPFAALMRLSVGEGLTLLVRHEQRHLGQAHRLAGHPDFPSA